MKTDEINLCLCTGKAWLYVKLFERDGWSYVECEACGKSSSHFSDSDLAMQNDKAIEEWNANNPK